MWWVPTSKIVKWWWCRVTQEDCAVFLSVCGLELTAGVAMLPVKWKPRCL